MICIDAPTFWLGVVVYTFVLVFVGVVLAQGNNGIGGSK